MHRLDSVGKEPRPQAKVSPHGHLHRGDRGRQPPPTTDRDGPFSPSEVSSLRPGPVTSLKWEQDYNFPLQISDRTNCSLRQKPRLSVPQARSGGVPANTALAQGTDLVGEAEALGELAHLAQGGQVLIQAADGLLDGLPIGGLRRPWRGQRKAMDT